jgi:hypothetical protein
MIKLAGRLAVAGAAVQIAYGVLACIFRHPTIADRPYEVLWGLATIGMIVNVAVWLANRVATPRLGLIGGGLVMLGGAVRAGISGVIAVRPNAAVDLPIVITIMLMFTGLALLGIATVRAHVLTGPSAWSPLIVLAAGLVVAPIYSFDKVMHFILLGLLWGGTWMYMALVGYRHATAASAITLLAEPEASRR